MRLPISPHPQRTQSKYFVFLNKAIRALIVPTLWRKSPTNQGLSNVLAFAERLHKRCFGDAFSTASLILPTVVFS